MTQDGKPLTGQHDLYATAAIDIHTQEVIIKIANTGMCQQKIHLELAGLSSGTHTGTATLLQSYDLGATNTIHEPECITPVKSSVSMDSNQIQVELLPFSFSVYRISL